jgi:DNA-binding LytR/AlgR family response regulator
VVEVDSYRKCVLVVEDDLIQSENLKRIIIAFNPDYCVDIAHTYEDGLVRAHAKKYDLIFFDIDLGSELKNGYDLAKMLRKHPHYTLTWMIFLTVRRDYELQAFKRIHCYDYLLKPYNEMEVETCLKTLLEHQSEVIEPQYLTLPLEHITVKVCVDEIIYIEVQGRGICIVTTRGNMVAPYFPLKRIEPELLAYANFMKPHRSYIVNIQYIRSIERLSYRQYQLQMQNADTLIPVTSNVKALLVEKLGI